MKTMQMLAVNSSLGGPSKNSGLLGKLLLEQNRIQQALIDKKFSWHQLFPQTLTDSEQCIRTLNKAISQFSQNCIRQQQPFMVISGDHSAAMGTWAGVLNAIQPPNQFGLLWLDAHLDAHTYRSSPSGHCHGMPVAAILGKADTRLRRLYPSLRYLNTNRLIMLGARSYELSELRLLNNASVQIIFDTQISNFKQTFLAAYQNLNQSCSHIGISLDLDLIDPDDAPAVATPEPCGIKASELLDALSSIQGHSKWCGLECAEFIPTADVNHRTLRLLMEVIQLYSSSYFSGPDFLPEDEMIA